MLTTILNRLTSNTIAFAALGAALAGCGQVESTTVQNPWASNPGFNSGQCPSGYLYNGGYCLPYYGSTTSGFTSSLCTSQQVGSQLQLSCAVTSAYAVGSSMNFPYLPDGAQTNEAWWGPEVRAGDTVRFEGAFRYGRASWASIFGDCSDERDGSGLMKGAVAGSYFSLPMNQSVTVPASGVLRIGMPSRHSCLEYSGLRVLIQRQL